MTLADLCRCYGEFVMMAVATLSNMTEKDQVPEPSDVIANLTDTATNYIMLPVEGISNLLALVVSTLLINVIGLQFKYGTLYVLSSMDAIFTVPTCMVTIFLNAVNFVVCSPFVGVQNYLLPCLEDTMFFPINLLINPLLNLCVQVLEVAVKGLIQQVLEMPIWALCYIVKWILVCLGTCIETPFSVLSMLVSEGLMLVCSLLRSIVYMITYPVVFIGFWALVITFPLLATVAAISMSVTVISLACTVFATMCRGIYYPSTNPMLIEKIPIPEIEEEKVCDVCFEYDDFVKLEPCGHNNVCKLCIEEIRQRTNKCPMCRANIFVHYVEL